LWFFRLFARIPGCEPRYARLKGMDPMGILRWSTGLAMVVLLFAGPFFYYRASFERTKRLREVTPGVFYRSGQMTAAGLADTVKRLGIRTVINLRDEAPDPDLRRSYLNGHTVSESDLCAKLGVKWLFIQPDLIPRRLIPDERPGAIERFLNVLDDPASFPILVHCNAGLNRTGVITAVYRMEHDGWTPQQAWAELRENGFGEYTSTADNDYITQYVLSYRPGLRKFMFFKPRRPWTLETGRGTGQAVGAPREDNTETRHDSI
jgi:tyrosine-protein phosphatase SIW14